MNIMANACEKINLQQFGKGGMEFPLAASREDAVYGNAPYPHLYGQGPYYQFVGKNLIVHWAVGFHGRYPQVMWVNPEKGFTQGMVHKAILIAFGGTWMPQEAKAYWAFKQRNTFQKSSWSLLTEEWDRMFREPPILREEHVWAAKARALLLAERGILPWGPAPEGDYALLLWEEIYARLEVEVEGDVLRIRGEHLRAEADLRMDPTGFCLYN